MVKPVKMKVYQADTRGNVTLKIAKSSFKSLNQWTFRQCCFLQGTRLNTVKTPEVQRFPLMLNGGWVPEVCLLPFLAASL